MKMTSKTLQYVINFQDFLTSATLQKRFGRVIEHFRKNPVVLSEYLPFNPKDVGGLSYYVSLGALVSALDNREFGQYATMATKVLDVLDHKTTGLMTIGKILQRIEVGYKFLDGNDNPLSPDEFEINGGTHRTIAILLAYSLSGHQINLDDILNTQVSVIPMEYSIEAIVSSNGSRAMSPTEKDWVDLSSGNIDRDVDSITKAIIDGKRTSTVGFRTALACLAEIDPQNILKLDTVGRSGSALYKKLVENRYKIPNNATDLSEMLRFAYAKGMPLGISSCKSKNITNIARDGITYLVDKMYAVLSSNTPEGFKAHLATIKSAAKEVALLANEDIEPDVVVEEAPKAKKTKANKLAKAAAAAVEEIRATGLPITEPNN